MIQRVLAVGELRPAVVAADGTAVAAAGRGNRESDFKLGGNLQVAAETDEQAVEVAAVAIA